MQEQLLLLSMVLVHSMQQKVQEKQLELNCERVSESQGYGHSMILRAYFRMMLSSAKMKSDLLTVRQFCRWGTGLYRAMVRARCALACFMEAVSPAAAAAAASCASPPPLHRSASASPDSTAPGTASSPNRAILRRDQEGCLEDW